MASTEIRRTTGSTPTNAEKFTVSLWFKKSEDDQSVGLFGWRENSNSGNNNLFVRINGNGNFQIYFTSNNGNDNHITLLTNRVFRDCNSWYHAVISVDSSQSTTSDRVKLYINGVQETSFSSASYPASGRTFFSNDTQINFGKTRSTGDVDTYFDGIQSHIHFTDGTAYDATAFGEYDANGVWTINTSPSVTYGNNGFWWLKDSIATTDYSPNSNSWSSGGGTLTKTEDCPSNVFNTFNPLDDYYEAGTFYNGNATYQTGTASNKYGRNTSTLGMTSGKFYWEVKPVSVNTSIDYYPVIGITASQITGSQDYVGKAATDYSWGTNQDGSSTVKYNNNNNTAWGNHFALNSIVGVAVDLDNNKIYFSKDGVWQESGDPTSGSTGTGAAFTITSASSTPLGAYFPSLSNYDGTGYVKFEANFGNGYFGTTAVSSAGTNASGIGIFEYDVPTGFTSLSTKGLNL